MSENMMMYLILQADMIRASAVIMLFVSTVSLAILFRNFGFFIFGSVSSIIIGGLIIMLVPTTKQGLILYGFKKQNDHQIIDKTADVVGNSLDIANGYLVKKKQKMENNEIDDISEDPENIDKIVEKVKKRLAEEAENNSDNGAIKERTEKSVDVNDSFIQKAVEIINSYVAEESKTVQNGGNTVTKKDKELIVERSLQFLDMLIEKKGQRI